MGNASDTSEYVLVNNDATLPNSRKLTTAPGLQLNDTGAGGELEIGLNSNLGALQSLPFNGIVVKTADGALATRTLLTAVGLEIVNPSGVGGDPVLNVLPDTNLQRVNVLNSGVSQATRAYLNFIPGAGMGITIADNGPANRIDLTFTSEVGADDMATYLLQIPNAGLPNAQAMSTLATGIVKNTTITGVQSIAIADVDYQSANQNLIDISAVNPAADGQLFVTDGGGVVSLPVGANGTYLSVLAGHPAWQPIPGATDYVAQGVDVTATPDVSYLTTGVGVVTITLPAVMAQGKIIKIAGFGAGGWVLAQQIGQQIFFGDQQTAVGVGGSLASTNQFDCVDVVCGTNNLEFTVVNSQGNLTIV
jgi:hypothetical protein